MSVLIKRQDQISSSEMTESVEEVTASTADVPRQVDELPHTWQVTGDMLEDPIVIAVMGVTGAGKSTFIKRIGGRRRTIGQEGVESEQPIIGHDTESGAASAITEHTKCTNKLKKQKTSRFTHFSTRHAA